MHNTLRLATVALLLSGCDRTEVQSTESPELAAGEGLLAIVVETDRPVLALHYVSPDNDQQFNLSSAPVGTSVQVHRVPAGTYCVRTVTWPTASFNADFLDGGRILCVDVQPDVLNYPGHMVFAPGDSDWSGSQFFAKFMPRIPEYEALIGSEYPQLVPWLRP